VCVWVWVWVCVCVCLHLMQGVHSKWRGCHVQCAAVVS
jgi:hypothetical protein